MDRGRSRSTTCLPRYQAISPSRSPLRWTTRANQRIFYNNSSPSRVNVYPQHHSVSPRRTYKVHLLSTTTNRSVYRNSRSLSAYDLCSSHLYLSNEDLFDKSAREATTERVASCEDIYQKTSFFPDATASESGVSFGESEEGSAFGVEDDNVSQHSFGSSSAFNEVTADSELDKCDSDNFSGPEGNVHINYPTDRSDKRRRGRRQKYSESQSPDKNYTSPFSYGESRKRELNSNPPYDFNSLQSHHGILRVHIPDSESPSEILASSDKVGDRKATPSVPLAHSTPHVSPGGSDNLQLNVASRWGVDNHFEETADNAKATKPKALGAMFDFERGVRHSSRLEDSSCNSSCSEDNYSDVSNVTVSSPIPRKTKLVKKPSDKPASSRALGSYQTSNMSHKDITSSNEESTGVPGKLGNSDHSNQETKLFTENIGNVQQVNKYNDWWTSYSGGSSTEPGADVMKERKGGREKLFSYQRNDNVAKPLSINIPLISAGKHGQEKLKQLSETSPPLTKQNKRPPTLSPTELRVNETNGNQLTDQKDQTNVRSFEESTRHEFAGEIIDPRQREEDKDEEGKRKSSTLDISRDLLRASLVGNANSNNNLKSGESPLVRKILQNEHYFETKGEARERVLTTNEREVVSLALHESDGNFPRQFQIEGQKLTVGEGIEKDLSYPEGSPHFGGSHEITSILLDEYTDVTSAQKETVPVSTNLTSATFVLGENSNRNVYQAEERVINHTADENLTNLNKNVIQAEERVVSHIVDENLTNLNRNVSQAEERAISHTADENLANLNKNVSQAEERVISHTADENLTNLNRNVSQAEERVISHTTDENLTNLNRNVSQAEERDIIHTADENLTNLNRNVSQAEECVKSHIADENLRNLSSNGNQTKATTETQRTPDTPKASVRFAVLSQAGIQVAELSPCHTTEFVSDENCHLMPGTCGNEVEGVSGEILGKAREHCGDGLVNSGLECQYPIDEHYLEKRGRHGKHLEPKQEVFDLRISPENDVCSAGLDSVSAANTHTVFVNGEELFLDNSLSEKVVGSGFERVVDSGFERVVDSGFERVADSGFESIVIEQNEQKASASLRNTPADVSSVGECILTEKQSDGHTIGEIEHHSECWESPQIMTSVKAAIINSNISTHGTASMSHQFPLLLEKADIVTGVNLVTHCHKLDDSLDDRLSSSVLENSDDVDKTRLAFPQKDILELGISGAAFSQSIKGRDDLELVIDKRISRDEQLWLGKEEGVVENCEGFTLCSGTEPQLVTVTNIPSKHIEHVSGAAEEKTVNSVQTNHSSLKLDSDALIVKDKSFTENIVKEGKQSTAIARNDLDDDIDVESGDSSLIADVTYISGRHSEHISCPVDEKTVNNDEIHHYQRKIDSSALVIVKDSSFTENAVTERDFSTAPARKPLDTGTKAEGFEHSLIIESEKNFLEASETEHPEVVREEGTDDLLDTTPSSLFSSSVSVMMPTQRITAQTSAPMKVHCRGGPGIDRNFSDNIHTPVVQAADVRDQKHVHLKTNMIQPAPESHLDNRQTQFSSIPGSPSQLTTVRDSVITDGYTQSASVAKDIVRGNAVEYLRFANTCDQRDDETDFGEYSVKENRVINVRGELSKPLVAENVGSVSTCLAKEHYDNDYDNIQNGAQLFTKPHRQHHMKPGNANTSNLWTLPEETDITSPKLPRVTLNSDKDILDNKPVDRRPCIPGTSVSAPASSRKLPSDYVDQKHGLLKEDNHTVSSKISVQKHLSKEDSDSAGTNRMTPSFTKTQVVDNTTRASDSASDIKVNVCEALSANSEINSHSLNGLEKEQNLLSRTSEVITSTDITSHQGHSQQLGVCPADASHEFSSRSKPLNITISWPDDSHISITGIRSIRNISSRGQQIDKPHDATFWSSHVFSLRKPEDKNAEGYISPLDKLYDSLQQFGAVYSEKGEWKPPQDTDREIHASYSADTSATNGRHSSDDDVDGKEHSTRVLDNKSPSAFEKSSGSTKYTCSGSAQIVSSYHYNIPAYIPKNIVTPVVKKAVVINDGGLRDKKIGEFDKILYQFSKETSPGKFSSHAVFPSGQSADSSGSCESSSEDLYKDFTNENSEKNQSHTCVVVEDENMNTFRFKRCLKKSHTKRNKGEKVMRFLSKLVCVSETVTSPVGNPHERVKHSQTTYSTESMPSCRLNISNPVLISSTSFYHHDVSSLRPLVNVNATSTPLSSSLSLDSFRSRDDSAYSSFSESAAGSLSTPISRNFPRTSHTAFESTSSAFCSGSTSDDWTFSDSVFSTNPNTTLHTSRSEPSRIGEYGDNKMSNLPDVFDKLNVSEEIDTALLNRLRYGHTPADVKNIRNNTLQN